MDAGWVAAVAADALTRAQGIDLADDTDLSSPLDSGDKSWRPQRINDQRTNTKPAQWTG